MDRALQESYIDCPYCWESISVLLNPEDLGEQYIEDCQVCCRPNVTMVKTQLMVVARREDDVSFE